MLPSAPRSGPPVIWRSSAEALNAHSPEQADANYITARDAWTAAMRAAGSRRPAALASLALAQEAYETATRERDLWANSARVPIPILTDLDRERLEMAISQEQAWREVRTNPPKAAGVMGRLKRLVGR